MSSTKVIILCGGQGTRIRDVADNLPKPMVTVGDRPILWHIMKLYAHYGVKDFVLCLGYKGWVIKEFFMNYQAFVSDITVTLGRQTTLEFNNEHPEQDWRIVLAETGMHTQTGGRIWRVRKYLQDSDIFCITYGDGVADIDISDLLAFHRSHERIGTVTGVRPAGRFGVLSARKEDDVTIVHEFREKPQTSEGLINGGFFVFDHRLWDYLSDDPNLIFEQAPLRDLAQDGQLALYEHNRFWQPMDTYREWKYLNEIWETGNAPWRR
jgi:glucose-1-phosphate cytidylyltransferase